MTEAVLQLLVRADGAAARNVLTGLRSELAAVTAAEGQASVKAQELSTQIKGLETAVGRGGSGASRSGGSGAAGAVGNLVGQFNDIGVMLAAGQNPLQLAIQQGTQITQVLGPMGAAGAARALGAAFLSMVQPFNIAVLAAIAGGAALVNWLTSAATGADAAAGRLEAMAEAAGALDDVLARVDRYRFDDALGGMRRDAAAIRAEFETLLGVIGRVQAEALQAALREARQSFGLEEALRKAAYERDIAARLGAGTPGFDFAGFESFDRAVQAAELLREIQGETREEILASVEAVTRWLRGSGLLTAEVERYLATLAEQLGLHDTIRTRVDETVASQERAFDLVSGIHASLADAAAINLARVFSDAWGPATALLGRIGQIVDTAAAMASAYAEYGPGGVIPGTAIPRGTYAEGGMDAAARGEMRSRPWPFPRMGTGAAGPARMGAGAGGGGRGDPGFGDFVAQAERAMQALDIAVAAVNEKVRAGLLSTAEGADAVATAKRSAADAIAELIPRLERAAETAGPKAASAVEEWRRAVKGLVAELGTAGSELTRQLSDGFSSAFAGFISGARDGSEAFEDFGRVIQSTLAKAFADRFTARFITPLIDSIFKGFATGGVPELGAFANGVVAAPTLFAMGGGQTGLMGEAGPEAIMPLGRLGGGYGVRATGPGGGEGLLPLTRTAGGMLGVALPPWRPGALDSPPVAFARGGIAGGTVWSTPAAPAGAGAGTIVNITNAAAGTEARAEERTEGGRRIVDVLIEQIDSVMAAGVRRGSGALHDAMAESFGLARRPR